MIAALYARKSTAQEGAGATSESVDRQLAHARAYAARKGWTVDPAHVYYDDNVSGAAYARLEQRNRLVEVCEARPPFQVLIVSEQSRLGRHMIESAHTIMRIADGGVQLYAYLDDREISVEDEVGQAMTVLQGFASSSERRQAGKRVYDAAVRRVRAGHVAGTRIYGYDNVPVLGADGKRRHTLRQPNPAQAAVIQRIFALYADGLGSVHIARRLNAERVPAPRPKGWSQTGIRGIVRNPIYRGEVVWGRRRSTVSKGREHNVARPEAEWLRCDAPELRLVDEALWQRAQAQRAARQATIPRNPQGQVLGRPTWRDKHSEYLLPGFLSCAVCQGNVRTITAKHGRRPRRVSVRFYGCAEHENRGPDVCTNDVRLRHEVLDQAVLAALAELLDERLVDAAVDKAVERLRAGQARHLGRRGEVERELSLLEHRLRRGYDELLESKGTEPSLPSLRARLREDEARKAALVAELGALAGLTSVADLDTARLKREARTRVADVRGLLGRHVPQARQMLRKLLAEPMRVAPIREGARTGLRFEGSLVFDRVLTGAGLEPLRSGSSVSESAAMDGFILVPFSGRAFAA